MSNEVTMLMVNLYKLFLVTITNMLGTITTWYLYKDYNIWITLEAGMKVRKVEPSSEGETI